ncbi:hypothetical protein BG015_003365, partial [Linnemannia schmuckeri]
MSNANGTPANGDGHLPYDERDEDYQEFEEYDEVTKPTTRPFYKRRKYWYFCAVMTVLAVAIGVPLALFVILPKVAQLILNNSTMTFKAIQITNPTNTSLQMSMDGDLGHTGPFAATIEFPEPIKVFYGETELGDMSLPPTKASGGSGKLVAEAQFNIKDQGAFGSFSADMMNKENFVWTLKSKVTIKALGRTVSDLNLDKDLVLN